MKSLAEYLTESAKTYPFKVGIAGDLPEGFADTMESCLQKFGITQMSAGKKTPIQERPLDFPQLENCEVTYYEVELSYPTTQAVLAEYIAGCCDCHKSNVIARNPNEPLEEIYKEKDEEYYETKLTKEDMGGESAQESVGSNKVMDLLKELESSRKDRGNDSVSETPGAQIDTGDKSNTKAVVGG